MKRLLAIGAIVVVSGCAVHQAAGPSDSGPSEAAISLRMFATPDRIAQDGAHPSTISVTAFDAGGHPLAVQVHLSIAPSGFGTFTAANLNGDIMTTTDTSKPTTVQYLPPATTSGGSTTVTISAQAVRAGTNQAENSIQQVTLVAQPAVVLSPTAPLPVITLTPNTLSYATNSQITFDGTGSCATGLVNGACPNTANITKYTWNFGDNTGTFSGSVLGHSYSAAGTYTVTLTILTDQGGIATVMQTLTVAAVASPTAAFVASPTSVARNNPVNFNAATSSAAAGHTITKYDWNFGDGTSASTTSTAQQHTYTAAGTYTVSLTVTDDVGQTKTVTATVTIT